MKKRKPDKLSDSTDVPAHRRSQNGPLQAAIEKVFRLTHGREMTTDERRVFGLASEEDSIEEDSINEKDRRSSYNHHNRDGL